MRRRLITLVLVLLLGAIVNVGVAWTCMIVWPRALSVNVYYWDDELRPTPAMRILESLLPSKEYARRDRQWQRQLP